MIANGAALKNRLFNTGGVSLKEFLLPYRLPKQIEAVQV